MHTVTFDIETAPIPGAKDRLPAPSVALGRLVDPVKIAAKEQEALDKQLSSLALDPEFGQLLCLGLKIDDQPTQSFYVLPGDFNEERSVLGNLWQLIQAHPRVITFFGCKFDLPFLIYRSLTLNRELPEPQPLCVPYVDTSPYTTASPTNSHVDMSNVLQGAEPGFSTGPSATGRRHTLETYASNFLAESCPWGNIDKSDLASVDADLIKKCCEWDVTMTYKLYQLAERTLIGATK